MISRKLNIDKASHHYESSYAASGAFSVKSVFRIPYIYEVWRRCESVRAYWMQHVDWMISDNKDTHIPFYFWKIREKLYEY